jgi:hypothetical protein
MPADRGADYNPLDDNETVVTNGSSEDPSRFRYRSKSEWWAVHP